MSPEELLAQLLSSTASARKAQNLKIIHMVCKEQFERGSPDFSIATIAKLVRERGGPGVQTIYNKTGSAFRALISAWCLRAGGDLQKMKKSPADPMATVLEKIDDPAVRVVMGSVLAENRKLRGELNVLKSRTTLMIDRRPMDSRPHPTQEVPFLPASTILSETEKAALSYAISEQIFLDEGWAADSAGRVLNAKNGRVIQKPGYVLAISKILACEEPK